MKIFFDTEFTGLHKGTTPISIGMVSEDGKTFYAEFTDYDKSQVDPWIQNNVIDNLKFNSKAKEWFEFEFDEARVNYNFKIKSHTDQIKCHLKQWLSQFDKIELWNDCLSYDWVLLADLLGGIEGVTPEDNYYYSHSLCSLDVIMEITDNDYKIMWNEDYGKGHNSLYDAIKIKECYDKTMKL